VVYVWCEVLCRLVVVGNVFLLILVVVMRGDRSVLLRSVFFISGLVPHTNMDKNKKWATFTFISPHICKITNLFRKTDIKIAFRCRNTTGSLIKPSKDHDIPPHNKWGIYQLTCNTCNLSYVGQTNRNLKICIQEHIRYIRSNNPNQCLPNIFCKINMNMAR